MSSREESTPTFPEFEETAGIRETLAYLFAPEDAETLRRFGRLLYTVTLESDWYLPPEETTTRREIGAALADVRHLQSFLAHIGREAAEAKLHPADVKLSLLASELTIAMGRIGDALEDGLK